MLIKKYKVQLADADNRTQRLNAYATQGRSYRKTQQNRKTTSNNLLKGSLAALIPLAAVGTLSAQCQGSLATITFSSSSTSQSFDIDGDGNNDFRIGVTNSTFFLIGGLTGNAVAFQAGVGAAIKTTGTVTRASSNFNGFGLLLYYSSPVKGNFSPGTNAYIPFRKGDASTGQPGWIQLEVISYTTGLVKFKIHERGVESLSNDTPNSAIIGDCNSLAAAALPVEMLYFKTVMEDKNVHLNWATAAEINNEGFEVQRSTDGRNFAKIGWVSGQGTTTEQQEYAFIDDAAQANTPYYYRLKQMDFDGTTEYSKVRTITLEDANSFGVSEAFPNPTGNRTAFRLNLPTDRDVQLTVFDVSGRLVKERTDAVSAGTSMLRLNTTDLPNGQYFVKLQFGDAVEYRKLMVNSRR